MQMDTHTANADRLCAVCRSTDHRGDLHYTLFGEEAAHVRPLCSPCFGLLRITLTDPEGHATTHRPTTPAASQSVSIDGPPCDICLGPLGAPLLRPIELVPAPTAFAPILTEPESPLRLNACARCHAWTRDLVEEEMVAARAVRSFASIEAGPGKTTGLRCVALGLSPAATAQLAATIDSLGGTLEHLQEWSQVHAPDQLIFAWADARLACHAASLPASLLDRTVVIADPAEIDHALVLMRAGARDLLVAPLSRQQVLGALDRMADPDAAAGRDTATGILSYRPAPRFGLPCHLVTIEPPDELRGIDAYLVLRRFLRGYDRVGLDSGSLLPVALFCDPRDLENVVGRIRAVLGPDCSVSILATVTEFPRLEEAWVDDLDPAALRRFGRAG